MQQDIMGKFPGIIFTLILIAAALYAGPVVELIEDTHNSTRFRVLFDLPEISPDGNGEFSFSLEGCGVRGEAGGPALYGRTFFVAVQKGSTVEVIHDAPVFSEWLAISPVPAPDRRTAGITTIERNAEMYSESSGGGIGPVRTMTMRGVELAAIDVVPVEFDPAKGVRFFRSVEIEVRHTGGGDITCEPRLYHPVFEKLWRGLLVNPEAAMPRERPFLSCAWDPDDGAELLVIASSYFLDEIEPWIMWKIYKGIPTKVVTTAETGATKEDIQAYLQNAYDTWPMPPVFALFVGDNDRVPTYEWGGSGIGDGPYGCVDGTDYIPEILTGRLSADLTEQMEVLVRKHLNFEFRPDTSDDWFARGVGVVNEDGPPYGPDDSSYAAAVIYAMDRCLAAGFSSAPVFRDSLGHSRTDVLPYIQAGCAFVNYRGQAYPDWYSPFRNLFALNTGRKCPVTVSITCVTGGFQSGDNNLCERSTRAGTVANPQGSVAWIGQGTVSSYTPERSSLSKHIFEGFFPAGLNELGAAHLYGKNELIAEFGPTYQAEAEYTTSTLIGSPEMLAWTAPIGFPNIVYPPGLPIGPWAVPVNVSVCGEALCGARVAITQDTLMFYALTDSLGNASVGIDLIPDALIPIVFVVTGPNIYPFIDTLELVISGVVLFAAPVTYEEDIGNGDGLINPGETFSFIPEIVNLGADTATGLTAVVRTVESVVWIDSLTSFPDVANLDTVGGVPVSFYIPPESPGVDTLDFEIYITGHPDGPWSLNYMPFQKIYRFRPVIDSTIVRDNYPYGDDDGVLDAGESADICVYFRNTELAGANWASGAIYPLSTNIVATLDSNYHSIWLPESSAVLRPCFHVTVSPEVTAGADEEFYIDMIADCNTYTYRDTFDIFLTIGDDPAAPGPWLYFLDSLFFEDFGDGDGILEPGENVGIRLRILNGGSGNAAGVLGKVIPTPFAYSDGSYALFGDIFPGATAYNSFDAIICTTAVYTPADTTIEVPIRFCTADSSYCTTVQIWMKLGTGGNIGERAIFPDKLTCTSLSPNPFNSSGKIVLSVPEDHPFTITINAYDICGRNVAEIYSGILCPGNHEFEFSPTKLPSGIYLINIVSGPEKITREALLIR